MDSTPIGNIGNRPIDVLDSAAMDIQYDQLMQGTPVESPTTEIGQPIIVNGGQTASDIAVAGEVDTYRFEITEFGSYTIETAGIADTMLTLFGPNSVNDQIAFNDDAGENFNARIQQNLSAGTYYAQVRLYNMNTTGDYNIQVTATNNTVQIPELTVDANPISAAISAENESDLYRFQVTAAGKYKIESNGSIDTYLSLYGPDSQSSEIASDDDSGISLNSRIDADLGPGEYFARIRHYSMFGTGPYSLSVRKM